MKALDLNIILKLVDKVTSPLRGVSGGIRGVNHDLEQATRSAGRFERVMGGLQQSVDRLNRGISGLGKATTVLGSAAGLGGGLSLANATNVTADFETINTTLDTLYRGDAKQVGKAQNWIKGFMAESPFETKQITEAFTRLKAYGMDPMDGTLNTLGDTAAAMGKDVMAAVEMMSDAIMGENERLKEFGIKGSAIQGTDYIQYDYTDKNGVQQKLQVLKNDRAQIQKVLTQILNENYGGAQAKLAKTFKGITSNTKDALNNLQMQFMNAGIFQFMKDKMQGTLETLNALSKSGKVEHWGQKASHYFKLAYSGADQLIHKIIQLVTQLANLVGGWDKLAMIGAGLSSWWAFGGLFKSLAGSISPFTWGLGLALGALLRWRDILPSLSRYFPALSAWLGERLPQAGAKFKAAWDSIIGRISGKSIALPTYTLSQPKAASNTWQTLLAEVEQIGTITLGFNPVAPFTKALTYLQDKLPAFEAQVSTVFKAMGNWVLGSSDKVKTALSGVGSTVLTQFSTKLEWLSAKAKDGSLHRWLDIATEKVKGIGDNLWDFGSGLLSTVVRIGKFTAKFVEFIGGWDKFAALLAGGWLIAKLSGFLQGLAALGGIIAFLLSPVGLLVTAIAALAIGARWAYLEWDNLGAGTKALIIGIGVLTGAIAAYLVYLKAYALWTKLSAWWTATLAARTALLGFISGIFAKIAAAARLVGTAIMLIGRALLLNPIGLLVAVLAGGAYLIYKNWDRLKAWWNNTTWKEKLIDIKNLGFEAIDWVKGKWSEFINWFGATELGKKVIPIASEAIDGVKGKWSDFSAWFSNMELAKKALPIASEAIDWTQTKASEFTNWWANTTWQQKALDITTASVDLARSVSEGFLNWWNQSALKQQLVVVGTEAVDWARNKWTEFSAWWDALTLKDIGYSIGAGFRAAYDLARGLWEDFIKWWDSISLKNILPDISLPEIKMPDISLPTVEGVTNTLDSVGNAVSNSAKAGWEGISGFFSGIANGFSAPDATWSYGGGRATGGPVMGGHYYQVNETGVPELLNMGGKTFLMATQAGQVVPLTKTQPTPDNTSLQIDQRPARDLLALVKQFPAPLELLKQGFLSLKSTWLDTTSTLKNGQWVSFFDEHLQRISQSLSSALTTGIVAPMPTLMAPIQQLGNAVTQSVQGFMNEHVLTQTSTITNNPVHNPIQQAATTVNQAQSAAPYNPHQFKELPEVIRALRVKTSQGTTKTLAEMEVTSFNELQTKGGQAFAGGFNDPATLYATALVQQNLGKYFTRVSAQNDTWHRLNAPKSGHTQGFKTDFTVNGISYQDAHIRTSQLLSQYGLKEGVDFKLISKRHGTGDHIDLKLNAGGRAKMAQLMQPTQAATQAVTQAVQQVGGGQAVTSLPAGLSAPPTSALNAALSFKSNQAITGLNEAQTRALAANTMMTESAGRVDALNSFGFGGQYQMGADALADLGLINKKALADAKRAAGKQWYKGGYHKAFLANNNHWLLQGGQRAFLANKTLQDELFIKYTNNNIKSGLKSGAIRTGDDAAKFAAYAKAAHLKGTGGANKLFLHGKSSRDAYGTSTADYAKQAQAAIGGLAPLVQQRLTNPAPVVPFKPNLVKTAPIPSTLPPALMGLPNPNLASVMGGMAANDALFAQAQQAQQAKNDKTTLENTNVVALQRSIEPKQPAYVPPSPQPITININAVEGMSAKDIAKEVERVLRERERQQAAKHRGRSYD